MSFLLRIAERALARTPVVEPLVASRFAPRRGIEPGVPLLEGVPPSETTLADVSQVAVPPVEPSLPSAGPVRGDTGSAPRNQPPRGKAHAADEQSSRPQKTEYAQRGSELKPTLRSPGEKTPRVVTPPGQETLETPRPTHAGTTRGPSPRVVRLSAQRQRVLGPPQARNIEAGTPELASGPAFALFVPAQVESSQVEAEAFENSALQPASRPVFAPLVPAEGESLRAVPQAFESTALRAGAPIRVTIGRVEVRAVQPTPPKPKAESKGPAPGLSLDEYLKRFSGDRR